MKAKKAVNMRLSEQTISELEKIASRYAVSQADVVTILVHCYSIGDFDGDRIEELFDIARKC